MDQQLDAKSWQATQPLSCPLRDAKKNKNIGGLQIYKCSITTKETSLGHLINQ
jgi:hypothetical protein